MEMAPTMSMGSQLAVEDTEPSHLVVARETQRVMGPHLDSMRKVIQGNWPELDPELMLLHWLCQRHKLEPPKVSLQRKNGRGLQGIPEPQQPEAPPPAALPPPRPGRTLTQEAEPASPREELPGPAVKLDLGGHDGYENQFDRDLPQEIRLSPCLSSRLRQRRDENSKPMIKSLAAITNQVQTDVMNLDMQAGQFSKNLDAIATHVATMRQELRGKFVGNVPLLSLKVLTSQEQFWLVGKLRPWNFEAGDTIFAEGDVGDKLYIIERGFCEIWKRLEGKETFIAKVQKGDFFGELAVMYDMPRSATVRAISSITLLSLSREDLFSTLPADKIQHMKILARAQVFSSIPVLSKVDTQTKVLIAGKLRLDVYAPGSVILRENSRVGGATRRLYIIEKGQCLSSTMKDKMDKIADTNKRHSRTLVKKRSVFMANDEPCQAGAYFGMLEFLYGCPQMNTLKAVQEVITLSISFDEMRDLFVQQGLDCEANFAIMTKSVRTHLIFEASALFKTLSEDELNSLLSSARTQTYEQWETIFRKDEPLQNLSILEQGSCIAYDGNAEALMECLSSSVECTEYTRPGETFGTRAVLGKRGALAPFTLVAISQCTILHITAARLQALPKFRDSLPPI